MTGVRRFFGLLALLGFVLSLIAHLASLTGFDVAAKYPYVWGLHVGIFVVFFPFVLMSRKTLGRKPSFAQIRERFPLWVVAAGAIIFAYAMLNFLLFGLRTEGGSPSTHDGKFVLEEHGRFIRELSPAEYTSLKANEVRGFSGHWLVFYYIPFAYFMFYREPARQGQGDAFGSSGQKKI